MYSNLPRYLLFHSICLSFIQDLIIIPGDASFIKVAESSSGRVFVLKFESSDQKHFVSIISLVIHIYATNPPFSIGYRFDILISITLVRL
jgi:hypothetical protein